MNRVDSQPAFILHLRAYRETSFIMEVLSFDYGRVSVIARGVRGDKKNTAAHLQPFRQLLISWRGRGELYNMSAVEEAGQTSELTLASLYGRALFCGYYINELTMRLLPRNDPSPEIFAAYNTALQQLQRPDQAIEQTLRRYEITLLSALGYPVAVTHDAHSGEPIRANQNYHYVFNSGPVLAIEGVDGLQVSGATLLAIGGDDFSDPTVCRQARHLMRAVIDFHLEGKALKSRELFQQAF